MIHSGDMHSFSMDMSDEVDIFVVWSMRRRLEKETARRKSVTWFTLTSAKVVTLGVLLWAGNWTRTVKHLDRFTE
jgi:hypothetical protein